MKTSQNTSQASAQKSLPKYAVKHSLVNYYLALMFSFFPLFLSEQYAHARLDKYFFYVIATVIFVVSTGLCMFFSYKDERCAGNKTALLTPLSVTDICMLCFLGFAVLSTLMTEHPNEALLGPNPFTDAAIHSRNNGLLLLLLYTLMYFVITRNYVKKDYVFIIFLVTSSVIALLTVLNFFYIDPFGLLDGYDAATIDDFGSTLGNKNIIAAFMCVFLPAAVMLFVISESKIVRIIAGFSILFAYTGLLCADSTSDILGLLVILPVMAIFCARSFTYLRRYLLALTILFVSGKVLWGFALLIGDHNKGFEFMQHFLIYSRLMFLPIAVCCLLYLLIMLFEKKIEARYPAKALTIIFTVLFLIGIIAALAAFVYFSFIDRKTDIGNFKKLLRFDDYWGTHRGFMWRVSFEEFGKFKPMQLLFGTGPDTAYYVLQPHFGELSSRFGDSSTDCAHNEFINYLLTQGVLGLAAYLGVMGSVIVRAIKTAKKNPTVLIFVYPVICYLAQSVVNLYNPIVTPFLFIFLSLTEATIRNEKYKMNEE
nr:O-antigen ligase family protein [uncultured Ruminococcus sp.]